MGVKWTEEQQKVIDLRGRNILVSAAAGSGKTAVLVERIIKRLTDDKPPTDVDRLLIVTFTEAAAAEMKERIGAAIERKLEERPGDTHLEQQATLIHSAAITTIHSFCLSVIREHFHVIGIDPGFRIAEEGELKLLKQDVLDDLLEQYYIEENKDFLEFVEKFGTGRDDRRIEGIILKLYEFSRSYPQPERWLSSCVDAYDVGMDRLEENSAVQKAVRRVKQRGNDLKQLLSQTLSICEEPDGPYMYADMIESDLKNAERLCGAENFSDMYEAARGFSWKRLSAKKDESVSQDKKDMVKGFREQAKKLVKDVQGTYFYEPCEVWAEDMAQARGSMKMLSELVLAFSEMFSRKKRLRNLIDFSDMEQFALAVLTEEKDGELIPSKVAREYQERFDEVMIDEYQDSNLVQETILSSVSRAASGEYNIFMVGDVKQSIYRFRLSRPELFMEKFDSYSLTDSKKQRIDLHKNFRSRREVLDSVNFVFRRIMRKEFGGIEYDDNAALYPGAEFPPFSSTEAFPSAEPFSSAEHFLTADSFPEKEHFLSTAAFPEKESRLFNRTELLLLDKDSLSGEDERKAEAKMIARRIKELLRYGAVTDKESGGYRRVQYRDIVILTRSIRGWADTFSAVLAEEGIPAYSVSREGYFETYEVSVLLDYLKILDNARQDMPLAAALASPFGNLDTEELAQIRLSFPDVPFYEAAARCAAGEMEEEPISKEPASGERPPGYKEKLRAFFEQTAYFRAKVPYTAIHDLLAEIIERTGYGTYIAAMPGGGQRAANVEMLIEKAAAFEGTSYKGLFNFVRYIGQLKKYDVDYGEAGIMDEQSDTVRIMSIHKSKGLEFPIVFTAGMGKQFNMQDAKGNIVLHPEQGVGLDAIDLTRRTKAPTFLKKLIQEEVNLENLGEELRILYVAMTRAKEKLILTGVSAIPDEAKAHEEASVPDGIEAPETSASGRAAIPLYILESAKSYLDWLLPAVMPHTAGTCGCPFDIRVFDMADLAVQGQAEARAETLALDVLKHWDVTKCYVPELERQLKEQMDYEYPYAGERKMKLKFTVSELKKRAALAEEAGEEMYEEPEVVPLIPKFFTELQRVGKLPAEQSAGGQFTGGQFSEEVFSAGNEGILTGASRGSAYHKLLELLDFAEEYDGEALRKAAHGFAAEGKLSKEMELSIRGKDIMTFLECESGRRMKAAAKAGKLHKEQPFVLSVDAAEIYPGEPSGEKILIQGIIDVWFEEEDGLVVLDYKTDKVRSAKELEEKYHAQLDYYAEALSRLLEKPVKEKIIYSFTLGEEIRV